MCHKNKLARSGIIRTNGMSRERRTNPQGVRTLTRTEKDEAKAKRCSRKHGFLPEEVIIKPS